MPDFPVSNESKTFSDASASTPLENGSSEIGVNVDFRREVSYNGSTVDPSTVTHLQRTFGGRV